MSCQTSSNAGWAQSAHPEWSPDGLRIAFESSQDGNGEIWVMQADGTGARNLTRSPDLEMHTDAFRRCMLRADEELPHSLADKVQERLGPQSNPHQQNRESDHDDAPAGPSPK